MVQGKKRSIINFVIKGPIAFYRNLISPLTVPRCRFYPTCSAYFIQAVDKYGPWKGTMMGLKRVLRCHPFSEGGFDPLP